MSNETNQHNCPDLHPPSLFSPNQHLPVLLPEVVAGLNIGPNMQIIDGTFGGGGHTAAFLEQNAPNGQVLAIDADPQAIARARRRFPTEIAQQRLLVTHSPYARLGEITRDENFSAFQAVDAILLDLGVSSFQLDSAERGFSFSQKGPLDMRMDPTQGLDAAEIVNFWSETDLADLIFRYGDERQSRRIARAIVQQRPIDSTDELAQVIANAKRAKRTPRGGKRKGIHPATLTFQALRIAVNQELNQLETVLPICLALLKPGGRICVISFHSLEDRIVKRWIQAEAQTYVPDPAHFYGGYERTPSLQIITRKPITPSDEEQSNNPRSRSAKLRIAERMKG